MKRRFYVDDPGGFLIDCVCVVGILAIVTFILTGLGVLIMGDAQ